jgi:hypothetical protein
MRTTVLAYAIALVGLITMALGIWGLCILVLERMRVRLRSSSRVLTPALRYYAVAIGNDIGWAWPDRPCAGPAPSSGDFNHRGGSGRAFNSIGGNLLGAPAAIKKEPRRSGAKGSLQITSCRKQPEACPTASIAIGALLMRAMSKNLRRACAQLASG